ncbi:MAG: SLBB domain-containing protein, partial [candidate division Zixibacteria bacterium]
AGEKENDILLQDRDSLHIYAISEVTWEKSVTIMGEVEDPGKYQLYDKMTAQDLIFLAGSYRRSASTLQAELARTDHDGRVTLSYISLHPDSVNAVQLTEEDRLYIRQIPSWRKHRTVQLDGEVNYPGEYMLVGDDETLYSLLNRAGGFAPNAFPIGVTLNRQQVGKSLERLDVAGRLEKSNPIVEDSLGNISRKMFFEYEPNSVNRIVIDMESILSTEGRVGDIKLLPGDEIFVPTLPSGITVMGAVGSSGTIKFDENKKVKDYVRRAGNFTRQADKKQTQLIRASGEVYSSNGTLNKRVQKGDVIVVPTKIVKERDWLGRLGNILTVTTGMLTTVLLVDKL